MFSDLAAPKSSHITLVVSRAFSLETLIYESARS